MLPSASLWDFINKYVLLKKKQLLNNNLISEGTLQEGFSEGNILELKKNSKGLYQLIDFYQIIQNIEQVEVEQ